MCDFCTLLGTIEVIVFQNNISASVYVRVRRYNHNNNNNMQGIYQRRGEKQQDRTGGKKGRMDCRG